MFAEVLKKDAEPSEFHLEPSGEVEMEDGEMRATYSLTFGKHRRRRNVSMDTLKTRHSGPVAVAATPAADDVQGKK